ncbi:MAG: Pkinase-domain-containing protein [Aureobasidium pullulans]|nr:MAG: Pkinase-domain-containing protein [Aureobasidium pullulans]
MAVLWRATTRAKIPMLKPDMDKKINLTHAVNNRKILDPPLPDRYLGNAVSLAQVTPTATKDVIAEDALPAIALAIRSSISRITPQSIHDLAEWVAGIENKSQISINVDAFLGMDLAATSWQQMTSYTQQDFGFGVPKAVRFPKPDWEGYVFVYPEREEGVEVCVLLEDACQGRLREDEELGRYASLME